MDQQLIKRIKQMMAEKKMSQADLARVSGIRASSLSDYLTGKYQPKQDKIDQIAAAYGISSSWLRGYTDTPALTTDESELILQFRQLSPTNQEHFRRLLAEYLDKT